MKNFFKVSIKKQGHDIAVFVSVKSFNFLFTMPLLFTIHECYYQGIASSSVYMFCLLANQESYYTLFLEQEFSRENEPSKLKKPSENLQPQMFELQFLKALTFPRAL